MDYGTNTQQKLLSEADLTLASAVEKAKSMELFQRNAQALKKSLPFGRIENSPQTAVSALGYWFNTYQTACVSNLDGNNWKICMCGLTIVVPRLFVDHEGYT